MAQTQKMYLGGVPVIKNYFGEDPIVSAGAFPLPPLSIDYIVVAGGGAGGDGNGDAFSGTLGGGGGAGGLISGSAQLIVNSSVTATVGNGGTTSRANGSNSSFIGSGISTTTTGGGGGGSFTNGAGQNGGSGGGAAYFGSSPGTGISGQGFNGSTGRNLAGAHTGGAGGGAGGVADGTQTTAAPGVTWFGILFGVGGPGAIQTGLNTIARGSGGRGASAALGLTAGIGGAVTVRYAGTPRATGGTITQSGGFTFHTFTSGGTFTFTG